MVADPANYVGREQAYVKHLFLESYLESLIHKTASRFYEVAYVDGFTGPWQSSGENYADTSFGIALAALRAAKASWKNRGRDVRMTAYLVEKSETLYRALAEIKPRYPDVTIHTYNDDFIRIAPMLLAEIPARAFAFVFVDPKGWRVPMERLGSLLRRENTEVVFNFMFEFINRAASITDPIIIQGLDELMPHGSWRDDLAAIPTETTQTSQLRRAALIKGFTETLHSIGNYPYVAETPILRPLKDRILYSLFYATRHPTGIQVFRDCQFKTLRKQAVVRNVAKRADAHSKTGQTELFGAEVPVGPDEVDAYFASEELAAERGLLDLTPPQPATVRYGEAWPQVLAKHAVRRTVVNRMVGRLRKDGVLIFPDWEPRKSVPDNSYRMSRAEG